MNALIIGAGGIAHHHLNSLRSLGVEVLGIYDVDGERAAKLAAEYGTAAVTDVDRALEGADTVFLLTPPSTRLSYMKRICGKCKAVFAEKPLAVTVGRRERDALHGRVYPEIPQRLRPAEGKAGRRNPGRGRSDLVRADRAWAWLQWKTGRELEDGSPVRMRNVHRVSFP